MRSLTKLLAVSAMAFGLTIGTANADLQDILDAGVVRIGVPLDVPVFGVLDENQEPAGIDIDIARLVAEALGVELEMQQITGINRIPFLVTNKLDIVISVMGASNERAKTIMFSSPYSVILAAVFGPAEIGLLTDLKEVGDLKIGVPRGTTQDLWATELHPDGDIVRFEDDATTAAAFIAGQVDLFATANIVALDLAKQNPGVEFEYVYIHGPASTHMGVRQGDYAMLQWLNNFIYNMKLGGTLDELHQKWMNVDFPDLPPF